MLNLYDNGSRMSYVTWHLKPGHLSRNIVTTHLDALVNEIIPNIGGII